MLMTTYAALLMFILPTYISLYPVNYKKAVILIIFTTTFISPLLIMLILLNLQKIKSLQLNEKKERILPLFTTLIMYISAYIITVNFPGGIPVYITTLILSSAITILLVTIITLKFKISIHTAATGGITGFFLGFLTTQHIPDTILYISNIPIKSVHLLSLLIFIAGITASSRLILKAHTPAQIISGLLLGLTVGLASTLIYT